MMERTQIEELIDNYSAIAKAKRQQGASDWMEVITCLDWQQELWRRGYGTYLGNDLYVGHFSGGVTYTNHNTGASITFHGELNTEQDVS